MTPLLPLLGLILRGDAYGYELKQIVTSEFDPHWRIDFAQLYRSLAKLEAQGFVRARLAASAEGPARTIYRATARGRRAFETWLAEPAAAQAEFWVKARLAATLGYDAAALPLQLVGSDDPLLNYGARAALVTPQVMGSMAGLDALAAQTADIASTHLRDLEAREYNLAFVQRLIPEEDILLVNFAVREYGLLVARGNPKKIRGVRDLARQRVRMLNRPRGAGARLWLYQHLRAAHLDPAQLRGWQDTAATYDALAAALEQNSADAGPGLRVTAAQRGLDFIPLGEERFDLAMPRRVYESARASKLFDQFHSTAFRAHASALHGYDLSRLGRVVGESKFGRAALRQGNPTPRVTSRARSSP